MNELADFDFSQTGLALPALRGVQGHRTLYVTLPSNGILRRFFPIDLEAAEDRSQRALDPKHARDIADYVTGNQDSYALGAITYALDTPGIFREASPGTGVGILNLPLDARLRSIDGQHRREGLRLASEVLPLVEDEYTALLLYVEPDLVRRRQMFSDMNNTARRVSRAVNVAFDSRDPFARAANHVSELHPFLAGRVEKQSSRVAPGSQKLYTLGALHDALKRLHVGPTGRVKDPFKYEFNDIIERADWFFNALSASHPELNQVPIADETLLTSSTTLRVIAGACWRLTYDEAGPKISRSRFERGLAEVDFSPRSGSWIAVGFVSAGRNTPNARSQEVLAATDTLTSAIAANQN